MSRAFVKEQDGNIPEDDVPELPPSGEPNYITPEGFATLRARHQEMLSRHAALSASAEDPLQQQSLRELERQLHVVNNKLERAVVVDPSAQPEGEVRFGAQVDVIDERGISHHFHIVGQDEADVAQGRVSWTSPPAQALMGAQLGEEVEWKRPAGNTTLRIVAIRYPRSA